MGFPGGSDDKDCACNVGDPGSIPGLGRSPGEWNGNPLQYSCLENSIGRGAWQATVHSVAKSQTQLRQLSVHAHTEAQRIGNYLSDGRLRKKLLEAEEEYKS